MPAAQVTPNAVLPSENELPPATFPFTQTWEVSALHVRPGETQSQWRDEKVRGLIVTVGTRAKTFFFEHRVKGKGVRKPKIGRFAGEPGTKGWSVDVRPGKSPAV